MSFESIDAHMQTMLARFSTDYPEPRDVDSCVAKYGFEGPDYIWKIFIATECGMDISTHVAYDCLFCGDHPNPLPTLRHVVYVKFEDGKGKYTHMYYQDFKSFQTDLWAQVIQPLVEDNLRDMMI
jgi:hypothetical protein